MTIWGFMNFIFLDAWTPEYVYENKRGLQRFFCWGPRPPHPWTPPVQVWGPSPHTWCGLDPKDPN